MSGPSPLGRYAGPVDDGAATVHVRLLGVPVRVLAAAREHHDALLREFRLLALEDAPAAPEVLALTRVLGVRYAAAAPRPDALVDAALERGEDTVDLAYDVPPGAAAAAADLDGLMAEADDLCRRGLLMTVARGPVVRRFAAWYLEQFRTQTAGEPAAAWDGPLDP